MKICVTGGAGFIGSHLAKRLKLEGYYVRVVDIVKNEYFTDYCDEFIQLDLRELQNCLQATKDCQWVFNLACLMGGMGMISQNHAVILYQNTMISYNMIEACRINKVERVFYSSSACVYPEYKQNIYDPQLKESDAWPAQPQDAYGLEKLCTEELYMYYEKEYGIQIRIARYHNIYGPYGTWQGGKEKAPAAFARKAIVAKNFVEVWGNGEQTRSFCYIDDCVEGTVRLMKSSYNKPVNIGSQEIITINGLANLALKIVGKENITLKHIEGPIGVNGRNSDNTLCRKILQWEPIISLEEGMSELIIWLSDEIEKYNNKDDYIHSQTFKIKQLS